MDSGGKQKIEKRLRALEDRLGREDSVDAMDLFGALSEDALEFLIEILRVALEGGDPELAEYAAEPLRMYQAIEEARLAGELSLAKAKKMLEGVVETATKEAK